MVKLTRSPAKVVDSLLLPLTSGEAVDHRSDMTLSAAATRKITIKSGDRSWSDLGGCRNVRWGLESPVPDLEAELG